MSQKTENQKKKSRLPQYISLAILLALALSYLFIPAVKEFFHEAWEVLTSEDRPRIREWVSGFGWMGPLVVILCMILQMFLIVVPTILLMVVAILAYGPVWGTLIVLTAVFAASTVGYGIGFYFGQVIVDRLIGEKTEEKIRDFIRDYGFWAVVITRLNPFLSNDAISFVAGILRMGYWKFIGATLLGITPLTVFIAILGESNELLLNGLFWGSLVSLVIFGFYYYWDKKKRNKK